MLLHREDAPPEIGTAEAEDDDALKGIRCPHCEWRPRRHDLWACICGHAWNTFLTRGACPACGLVWRDTQCPRCHTWSPHEAWYESPEST